MKKIFLLAMIICFLTNTAWADTDAYLFATQYINILRLLVINAEKAEEMITEQQNSDDNMEASISLLRESRLSISRLRDAMVYMKPFINSENNMIRTAADATVKALALKMDVEQRQLALTERLFGTKTPISENEYVLEMGKIGADSERTWQLMIYSSTMITYCFFEMTGEPNATLNRLIITKAERKDLINELDELYGSAIKKGMQAGQTKLQVCGAIIRQVLADEFLSADE